MVGRCTDTDTAAPARLANALQRVYYLGHMRRFYGKVPIEWRSCSS
jgi:hypothetical protein